MYFSKNIPENINSFIVTFQIQYKFPEKKVLKKNCCKCKNFDLTLNIFIQYSRTLVADLKGLDKMSF